MGRIRVLTPDVVNKIAAGEVIERPASVVKELVENALDAGAASVRIEIEDGGRKLIRVSDDGCGIVSDDLSSAFLPHATSKLAGADDLFRVATFGFRGEALASIGSVARVHVVSRPRGSPEGAAITMEAGQPGSVRPAAAAEGTLVEVNSLFLNVPVRRRFLRSAEVEGEHIHEVLARFAIAHPRVRFEYVRDGTGVFVLPPAPAARERIAHFYGRELSEALIEASQDAPPLSFQAWLTPPVFSRVSLKGLHLYLNGRFIRDRVLQRAVMEAYRELLPHGRYPVAFVFLEVEPGEVDVNVHPTKIEVRFRQVWRVHDRLLETMRRRLLERTHPEKISAERLTALEAPRSVTAVYEEVSGFFTPPSGVPSVPAPVLETGRRFFQVHDKYLVEEAEEGIRVIDQHALHERRMLEDLRAQYRKAEMPRQRLLIPAVVTVTEAERGHLEEHRHVLESVGMEFEDFGPDSVAVRAVPALLQEEDPAALLRDLLDRLADGGDPELAQTERALEFMACRSAVTFGRRMAPEELERLLSDRTLIEVPHTCAHGRPTSVLLTFDELEKFFRRS
jgi:DNA mismatch repair protein MutL